MATPLTLLAVILHFCAAAATVEALVFDVPSGSSKCLTEELRRFAHSRASYRVAAESTSAADPRISARVTGPRGEELHLAEAAERGELRFQAVEDGEHTACFWTSRGAQVPGGGGRREHRLLLEDGRIASIAEELKKLEDSAQLIHEEMISLHQSEREMQRLNEDTATKIHSFTLVSLAMCVGVAGLQLWHLKTFFQKQHIM